MKIAIINYSTGSIDIRTIPADIYNEGDIEDYIYTKWDYKVDQTYYMCSEKLSINFFDNEEDSIDMIQ